MFPAPLDMDVVYTAEAPSESEVNILLDAIAADHRFTWLPLPPCEASDDVTDSDYTDHTPWFANCPAADRVTILETLRKFRVPPEVLRTTKVFPSRRVMDVRVRKQFASSLDQMLSSGPGGASSEPRDPALDSALAMFRRNSAAQTSQSAIDEYSADPLPTSSVATPPFSTPACSPASSPFSDSHELGDRLPNFSPDT